MTKMIPAFASDGRRIRSYSAEACDRLAALEKVAVRRNARGEIRAIHFRCSTDGGSPFRAVATMGQRYSAFVRIGDVNLWQLKDLDGAPEDYARVIVELAA